MPPIEFREEEKHRLVLSYTPDDVPRAVDQTALVSQAVAAGYGDLALDQNAFQEAARRIVAGETFDLPVGQRTDAAYKVEVAPDKMSATLTISPAHGGMAASLDDAADALAKQGVVFGIDPTALAKALATPGAAVVAARGVLPLPGVDGRLEALIEMGQARHPREDEKGHIDFRELGLLRSVAADTPLMRRHPPQPGTPGHNVLGAEIPAPKPKDVKFPVRLQGVQASPADMDLLVAAIAGQPVFHRDGVSVDPVLALPGVNLSTGNVDFVGTVDVKGDVQSGMKIKAGGDVVIHGTVESAEIEAGGEVEIKGGVIGQHNTAHGSGADGKGAGRVRIHAKSNVRAHHIENAVIVSEQSVFVEESVVQSEITAMDQVVVGKEGGRKGHIIGGSVHAGRAVTAYVIGAPGASETSIVVGLSPLLSEALDANKAAVAHKLKEHDDVEKVVKYLEGKGDRADMLAKARLTLEKTAEELAELMEAQRGLEAQLELIDRAEVVAKSAVQTGVTVTIGRKRYVVTDKLGAGTFRLFLDEEAGREEVVFGR